MKTKQISLLALSLTLGVMVHPCFAVKNGETRTETSQTITRGTNNGVSGNWIEKITKTYRFTEDAATTEALVAAGINSLEPATAASIREKLYSGELTLEAAIQTIKTILKLKQTYQSELSIPLTDTEALAISDRLNNGSLTWAQLTKSLQEAKPLLASTSDLAEEWHSRDFDLTDLRATFGNSGGWIDSWPSTYTKQDWLTSTANYINTTFPNWTNGDMNKALAYAEGAGGDGASLLGQSSRLLKLSQLVESGILPSGKLDISGVFTHYTETSFTIASSPYYKPVTQVFDNSGGSWQDITSLVAPKASADEIQRAIYKWYSERWGQAFQIDLQNATAAQLKAAAQAIYKSAASTASPIALDLSGNNKIGVTGLSTAQKRKDINAFVANGSVDFDIFGINKPIRIEWMNSENDALLVDDRKGEVTKAAQTNGIIGGNNLFGNAGGFDNGYVKLAMLLMEQNKIASVGHKMPVVKTALAGKGLFGLKAWVDSNHDAKVQPQELFTLDSLGITELQVFPEKVKNQDGEVLLQSSYLEKGRKKLAEDVWFAIAPKER